MLHPAKPREHLRVLMTTDAVGGVWQYSLDLAAGLAQRGADVLLATMGPKPSAEQKQHALRIPRLAFFESDFALEWSADPWANVGAAGDWLLKLQSDFDADVIHLNGYAHAALAWKKPVLVVAHSCVYSWWRAVHGSAPGPEWNEYYRRVSAGLSAAHAIVAPSFFMAGELQKVYGVTSDKVQVIYNFSRARVRSVNTKQPFLLAAGRLWDPAKNITLLNRIAPELEWEVRVAGNEPRCTNSVKLLGVLPHAKLIAQMRQAAIFAHPALYEPFGLSILEAALSQCCLVIADIPSLRELWGDSAVLIDPRNPDRWIVALNSLARDPVKVQEFGRKARARANNYRLASALDQYWNLYRSLSAFAQEGGKVVAA